MDPLVTPESIDLTPAHVIAVVAIAIVIGVAGVQVRRFLMAYGDELANLWREYGPIALRRLLGRRRNMPKTPWFCARCKSHNGTGTSRCYSCGARRETDEAPVPNAEAPAGPSAGRSQRTRR